MLRNNGQYRKFIKQTGIFFVMASAGIWLFYYLDPGGIRAGSLPPSPGRIAGYTVHTLLVSMGLTLLLRILHKHERLQDGRISGILTATFAGGVIYTALKQVAGIESSLYTSTGLAITYLALMLSTAIAGSILGPRFSSLQRMDRKLYSLLHRLREEGKI